jgi:hypothetical protein
MVARIVVDQCERSRIGEASRDIAGRIRGRRLV